MWWSRSYESKVLNKKGRPGRYWYQDRLSVLEGQVQGHESGGRQGTGDEVPSGGRSDQELIGVSWNSVLVAK